MAHRQCTVFLLRGTPKPARGSIMASWPTRLPLQPGVRHFWSNFDPPRNPLICQSEMRLSNPTVPSASAAAMLAFFGNWLAACFGSQTPKAQWEMTGSYDLETTEELRNITSRFRVIPSLVISTCIAPCCPCRFWGEKRNLTLSAIMEVDP